MNKEENKIREAVSELKNCNSGRLEKYGRNLRYYTNTPNLTIDESLREFQVVGMLNISDGSEDDTTDTPSINVCKSCTDTLVSKISQSKARPFFNCVNGTFKDIQVCRQAQLFFDQYFDKQNVNAKVSSVLKDACIFDTGVIYVDDIEKSINRALPWQVYVRPSEMTYNKITRVYYERADFPVTLLPKALRQKVKKSLEYVTYGVYYDTVNHIRAQYVTGEEKMVITPYMADVVPFIFLHYTNPLFGTSTLSIIDILKSIQQEINVIMSKIKDCSQISNPLTYFVPEGSDIKATQLNNRAGNLVEYRLTPDMPSNPITVATQPFIDGQYIQWIDNLVAKAYELVGISQLSAQSKKPSGVNSGVGLQTLQDVESERFQTQLDQVIKCYVDIAKTCLKVFPADDDVLPETETRLAIKWSDVVAQDKKMSIQFSAADSLSKDPSTKLQQLQMLAQSGIIPQSRIAQFMQLPDLEGGYSIANNAINAVLTVIDDCIQKDSMDIPEYIPLQMLREEIISTQLSLRSANSEANKEDIAKLTKLYEKCDELDMEMQEAANQTVEAAQQEGQEQIEAAAEDPNAMPADPNAMPVAPAPAEGQEQVDLDMQTQQPGQQGW